MLLGHSLNGGWIKNPCRSHQRGLGEILSPFPKILLQPRGHRHSKTGFFAVKNLMGEIVFEGFPKNQLGLAPAHFVVGTKGEGVRDEIGVEEGHADFEGVGHAGTIDFGQDTLLQVKFRAKVEDSFEAA